MVAYNEIVEAWRAQLDERGCAIASGQVQRRLEWESDGVACCGKPDSIVIGDGHVTIYDLKSVEDASDAALARATVNYGWDIQAAAYVEGVEAKIEGAQGRVRYFLVACEAERSSAFAVNVAPMGRTMLELGARKWRRAKRTWGECMAANKFPGYAGKPIEATAYQLSDEQAQEMGESDNVTAPFME
jgi:hypothetical protein